MAISDLDSTELQRLIKEGVYQGVMKAIAIYALISLVIGLIVAIVTHSD